MGLPPLSMVAWLPPATMQTVNQDILFFDAFLQNIPVVDASRQRFKKEMLKAEETSQESHPRLRPS